MNRVADDVVRVVIRFTVFETLANSGPGQPHRERSTMVIAAVVVGRELSLGINRAAEFATANDQRVVEQASLQIRVFNFVPK